MHLLAQTRTGHASFVEIKTIAMLDKPVESSGELFYKAPDYFEKRTLKPKPESMVLDGGKLIIERGQKKHSLQLQNYPEVAAFLDSIRGTLAGDRKALEHAYQLGLEGNAEVWKLALTPIDEKMKKIVERINISGINDEIITIEIQQADGDSSLMSIEKLPAEKLPIEKLDAQ
jgi:outer membrane lipoprotein-sorting protein